MDKNTYKERIDKIMDVIKAQEYFRALDHKTAKFGDGYVGYYYSSDEYFTIKHGGVDITRMSSCFTIVLPTFHPDAFSMHKWLNEVEEVVNRRTIVIDGKKFLLVETK